MFGNNLRKRLFLNILFIFVYMKSIIILLTNLLIILLLTNCKKESEEINIPSNCAYFEEAPTRYMFAPDSAVTGSVITIAFVYDNQKPCQQFHSFNSNTIDTTTSVFLTSKIDTCNCQSFYDPHFLYFDYNAPSSPGNSIINFTWLSNVQHSDTIVIY